jgi:hypothetical protein
MGRSKFPPRESPGRFEAVARKLAVVTTRKVYAWVPLEAIAG